MKALVFLALALVSCRTTRAQYERMMTWTPDAEQAFTASCVNGMASMLANQQRKELFCYCITDQVTKQFRYEFGKVNEQEVMSWLTQKATKHCATIAFRDQ